MQRFIDIGKNRLNLAPIFKIGIVFFKKKSDFYYRNRLIFLKKSPNFRFLKYQIFLNYFSIFLIYIIKYITFNKKKGKNSKNLLLYNFK